jgi:hypothetical protein
MEANPTCDLMRHAQTLDHGGSLPWHRSLRQKLRHLSRTKPGSSRRVRDPFQADSSDEKSSPPGVIGYPTLHHVAREKRGQPRDQHPPQ